MTVASKWVPSRALIRQVGRPGSHRSSSAPGSRLVAGAPAARQSDHPGTVGLVAQAVRAVRHAAVPVAPPAGLQAGRMAVAGRPEREHGQGDRQAARRVSLKGRCRVNGAESVCPSRTGSGPVGVTFARSRASPRAQVLRSDERRLACATGWPNIGMNTGQRPTTGPVHGVGPGLAHIAGCCGR